MEKHEAEGKIILATLSKLAEAMDCELVYAFVPEKKVEDILWDTAKKS